MHHSEGVHVDTETTLFVLRSYYKLLKVSFFDFVGAETDTILA